jgi:hypothetical protein
LRPPGAVGDVSPDVAGLQPWVVRVDVKSEDAPRVDPDDLRRQVAVGLRLAGARRCRDGRGDAADLKEPDACCPVFRRGNVVSYVNGS